MGNHNFEELRAAILARSQAKTWDEALPEWSIDRIYWERDPETCLCTHHPINEYCFLLNHVTGREALVGNVCVKRFMRIDSGNLIDGIKRIAENEEKALNEAGIDFARSKGWLTDKECKFCMDTARKRKLSLKQMAWRIAINQRVMARVRTDR